VTRAVGALAVVVGLLGCGGAAGAGAAPTSSSIGNTAPAAPVPAAGPNALGDPAAAVQVEYYFDYDCPPCRVAAAVVSSTLRSYGDRIYAVYRAFPIDHHPMAMPMALLAEAARRQGRFFAMHARLMAAPGVVTHAELERAIEDVGLERSQLDDDLAADDVRAAVEAQRAAGVARGIEAVPTVLVGGAAVEPLDETTLRQTLDLALAMAAR
jgi:protein-disulfide isomerase